MDRGVELGSVLCPIFLFEIDNIIHLFFQCSTACQIWGKVAWWLDLQMQTFSFSLLTDFLHWIDARPVVRMERSIVESILWQCYGLFSHIRMQLFFDLLNIENNLFLIILLEHSFHCFALRNSKVRIIWIAWLRNQIMSWYCFY